MSEKIEEEEALETKKEKANQRLEKANQRLAEAEGCAESRTIKVSDLLKGQAGLQAAPEALKNQIQNNQELYATLSRSILELHNDMRQFRHKTEGIDKVMFALQQGVNKGFMDLSNKINTLDKELKALTAVWNEAVEDTAKKVEAPETPEAPEASKEEEEDDWDEDL